MEKEVIIMPCLDMRDGRVVKGVHFVDIADAGDPVECAKAYCKAGADELALLDITATVEKRGTLLEVVKKVSAVCTVPFTVGGGISDVKSAAGVLKAGANKVSVSSAAFRKKEIIPAMIKEFGPDAVTVAIDVDVNPSLPSGKRPSKIDRNRLFHSYPDRVLLRKDRIVPSFFYNNPSIRPVPIQTLWIPKASE